MNCIANPGSSDVKEEDGKSSDIALTEPKLASEVGHLASGPERRGRPRLVHPFVHPFRPVRRYSGMVAEDQMSWFLARRRQVRTVGNPGERRSPELISPWSQVRIPPPPPEDLARTGQKTRVPQAFSAGEIRAVHPLRHPCSRAQATSFVRVGYPPLADRVARRPGVSRTWPVAPSFQSVRRLCLTAHGPVTTIRTFRH